MRLVYLGFTKKCFRRNKKEAMEWLHLLLSGTAGTAENKTLGVGVAS